MEQTRWEPILRVHERMTVHGSVPERPYPQTVLEADSPWGECEVFTQMMVVSGRRKGQAVLCWNFLPKVNLCLYSRWREIDGAKAVFTDLKLLLKALGDWGSGEPSAGCTIRFRLHDPLKVWHSSHNERGRNRPG